MVVGYFNDAIDIFNACATTAEIKNSGVRTHTNDAGKTIHF